MIRESDIELRTNAKSVLLAAQRSDRLDRLLDSKRRTIGIDVDGLDEQMELNKQQKMRDNKAKEK